MSVLSIIETILQDVGKGIAIFEGIEPIVYPSLPTTIQPTVNTVSDDLAAIGQAITDTTAVLATLTGQATTTAAISLAATPKVKSILAKSELQTGKIITNQDAYNEAVQAFTKATADILNNLSAPKKVST
jgi:hypothetical protein